MTKEMHDIKSDKFKTNSFAKKYKSKMSAKEKKREFAKKLK